MQFTPFADTLSKTYQGLFVLVAITAVGVNVFDSRAQGKLTEGGKFRPDDPLVPFSRRWDIDGDRVSTCDEWKLFMTKLFYQADSNHDKVITGKEVSTIVAADPVFSDASFTFFDVNQDGTITRSEFVGQPNPFFVFYDTNKDCRVTAREIEGTAR